MTEAEFERRFLRGDEHLSEGVHAPRTDTPEIRRGLAILRARRRRLFRYAMASPVVLVALVFLDFATAGRYGSVFAWLFGTWLVGWMALAMHHGWSHCPLCGGLFYVASIVYTNPLARRCQGCALELDPPGGSAP
jgi:hypothetical protein